ncbi:MAG TPA: PQQ-binding-like beta-propeller repeat protein [Gemmataceae bacterium]|nr:PQQ-binding-like beta-propeller repeat protein [Gemmataceae bacterium]
MRVKQLGILCGFMLLTLTLLLVPIFTPEHSRAAEDPSNPAWRVFRGSAEQTGVAAAALPDKLNVLWKFSTKDSIEGAAAIADGVVYVGSFDEYLYALDLADGKEKWKYKAGPIKASPAVRDGVVYVGNADGIFHCVGAARGEKRWTFETDGEITSGANFAGDLILFGSHDETLYCLTKDGKAKWKFQTQGPVYGSPTLVGGKTFVAGCDSKLHVLDIATGKEERAVDLGGQTGATGAVLGDHFYVGTMTNQFDAIDWKKGQIVWTFQADNRPQPFYSSAAVTEQLVLAGSRDRRLHALDRKTGKEIWSFATGAKMDGSPVVAGKRVYAPSLDGNLYVLDLDSGKQLDKIQLDGPILGSPALAADRLVLGTSKGTVYCFGARK